MCKFVAEHAHHLQRFVNARKKAKDAAQPFLLPVRSECVMF